MASIAKSLVDMSEEMMYIVPVKPTDQVGIKLLGVRGITK